MVDPFNITNFNRSERQLQLFLIFSAAVAGHNAVTTDNALDKMFASLIKDPILKNIILSDTEHNPWPFRVLREASRLGMLTSDLLKACGLGRYNLLVKSFEYMGKELTKTSSIRHLELDDLVKIPGVGPKTGRFFLLHSRLGCRIAALDTHLLKFLRDSGVPNVPDATPSSQKEYKRLEDAFLELVPHNRTPADFDLAIWKLYRGGGTVLDEKTATT